MSGKKEFNADTAFEPIEVTIDGATYTVKDLTSERLNEITKAGEEAKSKGMEAVPLQFAMFIGEDASKFAKTDVRKLAAAIRFITEEIKASAGGPEKNA